MTTTGQPAGTDAGAPAGGSRFFVRQATGLVREASWVDAAIYNLIWSSVPLAVAFVVSFGPAFYLGGSLYLATILAFLLTVPTAFLYAMLSSAVPRSGGDYTWVSRAIHPALGFMSNLSFSFWATFFIGVYAVFLGTYGISPTLRVVAAYTGSPDLTAVADSLTTPTGTFIVGLVIVVASALLLSMGRGLRAFMRLQRWAFVLWALGSLALPLIIFLVTSPSTFAVNFDQYVRNLGGADGAHAGILAAAGYQPTPIDLGATILTITLPYYTLGFIFQSAYFGGEIKRGERTALLSIPGAQLIAVSAILLLTWAALSTVGEEFLAATGLAGFGLLDLTPFGLAFSPLFTELAAIASGNLVIGFLITFGMLLLFVVFVPQTMVLISRNLFAWSFDRLLPDAIAEVNPRTHAPVNAVLVIAAVGLVSVAIIAFNPDLTFIVGLLGLTWTYVVVAVAGILFPYRQREAFEASPYNGRLGGVPTMSIVGALSLIGMAAVAAILLLDLNSGTSWEFNSDRVLLGLAVFAAGLPIYYVIRAIQRGRGVDIDLAYRQIPPE